MTPRDPKRIDRITELLRQAWRLFPDQRLTQLVINTAGTKHNCGPVFYLEDTEMEKKLESLISSRRDFVDESANEPKA